MSFCRTPTFLEQIYYILIRQAVFRDGRAYFVRASAILKQLLGGVSNIMKPLSVTIGAVGQRD